MSRGSVIPYFLQNKNKKFKITDTRMTRFCITLEESVNAANWTIANSKGNEIIIPKMPSYRILDLLKAVNTKAKIEKIGIRSGEKLYEELISSNDNTNSYDIGKYFIVTNNKIKMTKSVKKNPEDFSYNSENNPEFYSVNELKKIISKTLKDG